MIVLRANSELKNTFETLIKTIGANVKWNGLFAAIDNYLVLQGEVRSLFFHFDSRKVVENIIDLPIKEDEIKDTLNEVQVQNVINMILYAFGKWGTIKGLKVEKNYQQLSGLFHDVLAELRVEPDYTWEYMRFYKEGIRITYEDVIQLALEAKERAPEESTESEDAEGGLWHKVIWKTAKIHLSKVETTLEERKKGRLGNNFYKIGYLCPNCGDNLHMVVYPEHKKFQIETVEGKVLLTRAFTCERCGSFYTPKPWKMFSEGDIYEINFEGDKKAYEDYLELLGENGDRVANHEYNQYADGRRPSENLPEEQTNGQQSSLEDLCNHISEYSEEDFRHLQDKVEEGFFPDESIAKCEKVIAVQAKHRQQLIKESRKPLHLPKRGKGHIPDSDKLNIRKNASAMEPRVLTGDFPQGSEQSGITGSGPKGTADIHEKRTGEADENGVGVPSGTGVTGTHDANSAAPFREREQEETRKKYQAKFGVLDRLSDRQIGELKQQLMQDNVLPAEEKNSLLEQVYQKQGEHKIKKLREKAAHSLDKNYAVMKRVCHEIEQEELPKEVKKEILGPLRERMDQQGQVEVKQIMEKIPPNLDRTRYKGFVDKLNEYEGVDLSPYKEVLKEKRQAAETQEVANMIKRARKNNRDDIAELMGHLKEQNFSDDVLRPYLQKLEEKVRQMDEDAIAKLTGDPVHMDFEEGMQAYEAVRAGNFLPDLKENALELLGKRLSKIKTDECELLVKKLQEELQKAGISENPRHHFYPARKVLLKQAAPEETDVIDYAVASYAAGKGTFEYPVCVVDTSRNETGKEGIILTPDHLYYSTLMTSYGLPVSSIQKVTASTGLLNKGVYIRQRNGTKTKIPYAVETKELLAYAEVLDQFIQYLQEKPESRQVSYLAKEKHETICCFRCGYVYRGGSICPKCGFKNNG